jgi:hypothetical protein
MCFPYRERNRKGNGTASKMFTRIDEELRTSRTSYKHEGFLMQVHPLYPKTPKRERRRVGGRDRCKSEIEIGMALSLEIRSS